MLSSRKSLKELRLTPEKERGTLTKMQRQLLKENDSEMIPEPPRYTAVSYSDEVTRKIKYVEDMFLDYCRYISIHLSLFLSLSSSIHPLYTTIATHTQQLSNYNLDEKITPDTLAAFLQYCKKAEYSVGSIEDIIFPGMKKVYAQWNKIPFPEDCNKAAISAIDVIKAETPVCLFSFFYSSSLSTS